MPGVGSAILGKRVSCPIMSLMRFSQFVRCGGALALAASLLAQPTTRRILNIDDLVNFKDVGDPQVSPDGKWVAYTVSTVDKTADKRDTDVWMVSSDGSQNIRLTYSPEAESSPRWSPDGKYLAFTSSRAGKAKGSQIWLLDRRGGEAHQLTEFKDKRLSDYHWSPDSKRLALVMSVLDEPEPDPAKPPATPPPSKPIVLDRYHFKQDIQGYLSSTNRSLIYLYNIESKKLDALTREKDFDENNPEWSPDGTKIAFVSNRDADWDRSHNSDVFVADAVPGAAIRKLTTWTGPDGGKLAWSADSTLIAYTQGSDPKYSAYSLNRLAVVPAAGGAPRLVTEKLDRGVSSPVFSPDGKSITFLVTDDRAEYPSRVPVSGGAVERLIGGSQVVFAQSSAGGHTAVLVSTDTAPSEVYALEGGSLRKLTSHNEELLAQLNLGQSEDINFKSKDGTEVHGIVTLPPGYEKGKKYPTLLRIHGGPNGQDAHSFQFEKQFLAAHGYVVIAINYRGSAGRGSKFGESIFADWGNREVADLLAGVDHVIGMGIADPDRLGIGGWSYGGILTDYTIASDTRFKAAISGAGSANQISMYGVDQYTYQYDHELGAPWTNPEAWVKISYPFFKADRIKTPTLFMGGDKDFNVPIVGSEQMYQALRSLGIPTQLVVYPGQFHGITKPSFVRDRLERYVAWYDKYLKPGTGPAVTATSGR